MPKIQVLIAAYGPDALERISLLPHASYPGVEYLIGWQNFDMRRVPPAISERSDFRIIFEKSSGLCNNRNALLREADGDIAVIADDDLAYEISHFEVLFKGIEDNPSCHFLTFRYHSDIVPKTYPAESFPLNRPPKGYFVTSMELVFNLKRIKSDFGSLKDVLFHPAFGVNGSLFCCGEEDIMVERLLRKGYKGKFIPQEICTNTDSTTSDRISHTRIFVETRGAVLLYIKPFSWPLRMIAHSLRSDIPLARYCKWWLAGVRKAVAAKIFKDY